MSPFTVNTPRPTPIRALPPAARVAALADGGAVISLDAPRPSPHLARFGIRPQDDDGVSIARIAIAGTPALIVAQDERFLGGSVGANHGKALHDLFVQARTERPAGVVLLLASGGVRLHEANAGELWLARALRALLDTRAAGVPVLAVATGHVFGGASVLACAADRLAMLPGTRIGVSGPKVIQSVHGKWELDADRSSDVDAVFGATARSAAGDVDLVADDADALRAWIRVAFAQMQPFAERVASTHAMLAARLPPYALRTSLHRCACRRAAGGFERLAMGDSRRTGHAACRERAFRRRVRPRAGRRIARAIPRCAACSLDPGSDRRGLGGP